MKTFKQLQLEMHGALIKARTPYELGYHHASYEFGRLSPSKEVPNSYGGFDQVKVEPGSAEHAEYMRGVTDSHRKRDAGEEDYKDVS